MRTRRMLYFVVFVSLFACSDEETTRSKGGISIIVEDVLYPEIMADVAVLDYNERIGLFLAGEYFSGNLYLFDQYGAVQYRIQAKEKGSPEDYGSLSSVSFFDDASLLVISQTKGLSRIDFAGNILERYELPYQPTVFGGRLTKKARWVDEKSLVFLLEGRHEPFGQVESTYPNPILEYWNPELGHFSPIITMPEESKYKKGKGYDYYWPQFSTTNGYLYYANENEPMLFIHKQEGKTFSLEQVIPLPLLRFYEPTLEVYQNLFHYRGTIYLIEEKDGFIYVFYHTGASNDEVKEYTGSDRREMYFLLMKNGVAIINRATAEVQVAMLPDEVQRVETILPNGLFMAKQNVYVNATEDDTNKRLLLSITLTE